MREDHSTTFEALILSQASQHFWTLSIGLEREKLRSMIRIDVRGEHALLLAFRAGSGPLERQFNRALHFGQLAWGDNFVSLGIERCGKKAVSTI